MPSDSQRLVCGFSLVCTLRDDSLDHSLFFCCLGNQVLCTSHRHLHLYALISWHRQFIHIRLPIKRVVNYCMLIIWSFSRKYFSVAALLLGSVSTCGFFSFFSPFYFLQMQIRADFYLIGTVVMVSKDVSIRVVQTFVSDAPAVFQSSRLPLCKLMQT